MSNFRLFLFLIICVCSSNCQQQSIVIQESSACTKNNYKIPLFSTEILRMTFNQTRLRQLNIHTLHIRASIANRKVAEFENHRYTIKKVFHLMNTTSGKYE
jgi:hypothetical protein